MSQSLTWKLEVIVVNGPHFSEAQALTLDAFDKVDAVVPAATGATPTAGTATVEVQPGGAGQVQFLLLTSSVYSQALTFTVDGGSPFRLDALLMLSREGVVALLGQTQKQFLFSNLISPAAPVTVSILVGRKATVV